VTSVDSLAPAASSPASNDLRPNGRAQAASYRYAHWYFLAALAATVGGFWPSFFRRVGAVDFWHTLHGVTATLWIVALSVQSWLVSRGRVKWHRRVAAGALVLLPIFVVSALYMVGIQQARQNARLPSQVRLMLAFIDLASILFLVVLVTLALWSRRTPPAHKRFMSATVLLGLPPALTRLYARMMAPGQFGLAFQASLVSVEVILIALIAADRRAGQRRLAYPLSLAFFVLVHVLIHPVSASDTWRAAMVWFASLRVFS
jgi:uncharacterized membrane protein YozB (DUF420 family)